MAKPDDRSGRLPSGSSSRDRHRCPERSEARARGRGAASRGLLRSGATRRKAPAPVGRAQTRAMARPRWYARARRTSAPPDAEPAIAAEQHAGPQRGQASHCGDRRQHDVCPSRHRSHDNRHQRREVRSRDGQPRGAAPRQPAAKRDTKLPGLARAHFSRGRPKSRGRRNARSRGQDRRQFGTLRGAAAPQKSTSSHASSVESNPPHASNTSRLVARLPLPSHSTSRTPPCSRSRS